MVPDLMSIVIALGIAGACAILCGIGLGVLLVAWGSYVAYGFPVSVLFTSLYLAWSPARIPWTITKR